MTILLASGSPRRRDLLGRLGVAFEVLPSAVTERDQVPGEDPQAYALALARQKAEDIARAHPGHVVLGADTVVALEGKSLGKPANEEDVVRLLSLLSGRSHTVITAVALRGRCTAEGLEAAEVRMRTLTEAEMRAYAGTGEPMDKAGAYAVQGLGGRLVESVSGCYETVIGLPLCLVARLLNECDVTVPRAPSCRHT